MTWFYENIAEDLFWTFQIYYSSAWQIVLRNVWINWKEVSCSFQNLFLFQIHSNIKFLIQGSKGIGFQPLNKVINSCSKRNFLINSSRNSMFQEERTSPSQFIESFRSCKLIVEGNSFDKFSKKFFYSPSRIFWAASSEPSRLLFPLLFVPNRSPGII